MRLTTEQQKIVEDNHNLIYWCVNEFHLDIEEYYDLFAIELCYTVQRYDATRGSLSNYFRKRCENLIRKEYEKTQSQKAKHNGLYSLSEAHHHHSTDNVEEIIELEELFGVENGEILRLKANGYTQTEIAERLGLSQSYISKILGRVKKEYYEADR